MKFVVLSLLAAASMLLSQSVNTSLVKPQRTSTQWQPAVFKGLVMGRATRDEVIRALGEPKSSELIEDGKGPAEEWLHYEGGADVPEELVFAVDVRTRVVLNLIVYPEKVKREDAIKHFGEDYTLARYEFCGGFDEEDYGPVYETPTGRFLRLEYRARGIAISLQSNDEVHYISYESRPRDSKCKPN